MKFVEDRRPTLASWPKRIYQWSELPQLFRPALEEWRGEGLPPGNVTYIPQVRQGVGEEEHAVSWWRGQVLLQTLWRGGVTRLLIPQGAAAIRYEVQLLKCTLTIYLKNGDQASFSYNKVKEDQLRPVLSLLLGRPSGLSFPTEHPEPERLGWLLEESYGMYHTALLCYRLGERLEDCLYLRGKTGGLLWLIQRTPDPEYFLGVMDRGLAAISHDSYSTCVLYAPWEGMDGAELVPERRGYSLQVQAAGGKMTIPVQGGQIEKVRNFLDHLSRENDQISQFH